MTKFVPITKSVHNIPAPENSGEKYPTPEQMLVRQATKYLTPKQKKVWEFHNFDRLTQDEIALKLGINQSTVARTIKACENRIAKYCRDNYGAYELLKRDYENE
jgi:RNA polymerase sigma factor (sigma-70 family)